MTTERLPLDPTERIVAMDTVVSPDGRVHCCASTEGWCESDPDGVEIIDAEIIDADSISPEVGAAIAQLALAVRSEVAAARVGMASAPILAVTQTRETETLVDVAQVRREGRFLGIHVNLAWSSIFSDVSTALDYEFWRLATHHQLGAGLDLQGRAEVSSYLLSRVERLNVRPGSVGWHMLRADTRGRAYFAGLTGGEDVSNRSEFATLAASTNLPFAVLHEFEKHEGRGLTGGDTASLLSLMEMCG